ncbi:hypothetical protein WAI453_001991 [Rhynchosporium graminicola]
MEYIEAYIAPAQYHSVIYYLLYHTRLTRDYGPTLSVANSERQTRGMFLDLKDLIVEDWNEDSSLFPREVLTFVVRLWDCTIVFIPGTVLTSLGFLGDLGPLLVTRVNLVQYSISNLTVTWMTAS